MNYIQDLTREELSELILKTQTRQNLIYTSMHKQYLSIFEDMKRVYGFNYKDELKLIIHNTACSLRDNCVGFPLVKDKIAFKTLTDNLLDKVKGTKVSYNKLWNLLHKMEEDKYLNVFVGGIISDEKITSRIVLTKKWLDLFTNTNNLSAPSTKYLYNPVVVHELDGNGNKIGKEKKNVQGVGKYKKDVELIRNHLSTFDITCEINGSERRLNTDIHRTFLGDLYSGGRWWFSSQNMKSEFRQGILINKENCTEWDYSSQHPRICYTLENLLVSPDFKPYEIDCSDFIINKGGDERALCKHIMMLLLNSGNAYSSVKDNCLTPQEPDKRVRSEYQGLIITDHKGLVNSIKRNNGGLSKYFGREGHSYKLQNLDSSIVNYILLESVKDGVCVLPYHDSFVTTIDNSKWLQMKMFEAWEDVLGTRNNCVIDCKF